MDSNSSHWYICEERSGEGAQFISYLSPSTHTHTHTHTHTRAGLLFQRQDFYDGGQACTNAAVLSTLADSWVKSIWRWPWHHRSPQEGGGRRAHWRGTWGRWSRNEWEEPWTCPTGCAFSGHLCPSLGPSSPTHVTESQLGGHLCPMKFLIPVPKSGAQ